MGSKINFLLLFFSNFHFDLLHKRNEGRNEKGKKSSQFQNMPSFLRPVWWFWCFQSLAPLYLTLTQSKWENVQFSWWKKRLVRPFKNILLFWIWLIDGVIPKLCHVRVDQRKKIIALAEKKCPKYDKRKWRNCLENVIFAWRFIKTLCAAYIFLSMCCWRSFKLTWIDRNDFRGWKNCV